MNETIQIKILREKKGLSVRALGARVGVAGSSVTRWETGVAWPTADKLPELAKILGCTIDELFNAGEQTG